MTHEHKWGKIERSPLAGEPYRECVRCGNTTTDLAVVNPSESVAPEAIDRPSPNDERAPEG